MEEAQSSGYEAMLELAISSAPTLPNLLLTWWSAYRASDAPGLAMVLTTIALVLVLSYALQVLLFRLLPRAKDEGAAGRYALGAAVRQAVRQALAIAVFYVIANIFLIGLTDFGTLIRGLAEAAVEYATWIRIAAAVYALLADLGAKAQGLGRLTAEEVRTVRYAALPPLIAAAGVYFVRQFFVLAVGREPEIVLLAWVLTAIASILAFLSFYRVRQPVAKLLMHGFGVRPDRLSPLAAICRSWYLVYGAFWILTDILVINYEIGVSQSRFFISYGQIFVLLLPLFLVAIRAWQAVRIRERPQSASRAAMTLGIGAALSGCCFLAAAVLLIVGWGIDPFVTSDARPVDRAVSAGLGALVSLVVGYSLWRGVAGALELLVEDAGQPSDAAGETVAASRFSTLYPLARTLAMGMIFGVSGMLALSSLGVEIAPLIAGAGVIGIAVGFGAQAFVKDIISGALYLQDDAFRLGEYIVTAEGKGFVENISMRSVSLRHHRGAVFTVPFGSMGTIQNHSRDWVKMKYLFEIPARYDLERIRKLVKRVGVGLLEDPQIAADFIEPVKSQGAIAIQGSNYVVGIKFVARPGTQFLIRRKAFVALQKAFSAEGIEFAHPLVTVETAEPPEVAGGAGAVAAR